VPLLRRLAAFARRRGARLPAGLHPRRPTRWGVAVPVVLALAGLMAATSAQTARGTDLRSNRSDTADLIREQQYRADVQAAQVARLRTQVQQLRTRSAPASSRLSALDAQAGALGRAAGATAVTGPALRVQLDDAPSANGVPQGFTADDVVVHQQDVQAVVNALWGAGAEAMTLMDQRVISTSAVRCVGNVLILQDRVYSPPYTITAIGDPGRLAKALQDSATVSVYREYVAAVGLGYDVRTLARTSMPGFDGSLTTPYARALRAGS
jgi:uncharacterized protein YlxW (UPF0749 family)